MITEVRCTSAPQRRRKANLQQPFFYRAAAWGPFDLGWRGTKTSLSPSRPPHNCFQDNSEVTFRRRKDPTGRLAAAYLLLKGKPRAHSHAAVIWEWRALWERSSPVRSCLRRWCKESWCNRFSAVSVWVNNTICCCCLPVSHTYTAANAVRRLWAQTYDYTQHIECGQSVMQTHRGSGSRGSVLLQKKHPHATHTHNLHVKRRACPRHTARTSKPLLLTEWMKRRQRRTGKERAKEGKTQSETVNSSERAFNKSTKGDRISYPFCCSVLEVGFR